MKKIILLLSLIISAFAGRGQNLVPNGDFEQYSGCPVGYHDFDSTLFWMNPATGWNFGGGSPDYFNSCNTSVNSTGVPLNGNGSQPAHSGNAYCGIIMYYNLLENREYIEVPLTSTLVSNACYHFEMYISLADNSGFTIDTIEAYLSDTAVTGINNVYALPFIPQIVYNAGWIFDTVNWILIEENIVAAGGENYLIIGNFNNNANTNAFPLGGNAAYFYIDDVSLTPCSGLQTHIQTNNQTLTISPNPAHDILNITLSNPNTPITITVTDIMGKQIFTTRTTTSNFKHQTSNYPAGIYFVKVITGTQTLVQKFVKE